MILLDKSDKANGGYFNYIKKGDFMNELLPVVLIIALLLCPFIVLYQYLENRKILKQLEKEKAEKILFKEKAGSLWKYQVIKNVDDEIDRKKVEAERDSKKFFKSIFISHLHPVC